MISLAYRAIKPKKRVFAALLALVFALLSPRASQAQELNLLLFSDAHSTYDRYPRLLSLARRIKSEQPSVPLWTLINGDLLEGGLELVRRSRAEVDFALLGQLCSLGGVILNLGNHEGDLGPPRAFAARARALGVIVIGSVGGHPDRAPIAEVEHRLPFGGEIIRVLGLSPDEPEVWAPGRRKHLRFVEPRTALLKALKIVVPAKLAWTIVLSHSGVADDRDLLPLLPDGTLLFGGHDHVELRAGRGSSVYVQAGAWLERVLVIRASAEDGGLRWRPEELRVDDHRDEDLELRALIKGVRERFSDPRDRQLLGALPRPMLPQEQALWVASLLRRAGSGAVGMVNHTSLGASLPPGPIDRGRFHTFLRFDNQVVQARVSGRRLQRILRHTQRRTHGSFAELDGDRIYAAGAMDSPTLDYVLVTTDWVAAHAGRYLGEPGMAFEPIKGLKTRALVRAALK